MQTEFVVIPDEDVEHIWSLDDECIIDRHAPEGDELIGVAPYWYQDNGTPICPGCGRDCYHLETRIRKQRIKIHVRGGVAYPSENMPAYIELEIIDHDNEGR